MSAVKLQPSVTSKYVLPDDAMYDLRMITKPTPFGVRVTLLRQQAGVAHNLCVFDDVCAKSLEYNCEVWMASIHLRKACKAFNGLGHPRGFQMSTSNGWNRCSCHRQGRKLKLFNAIITPTVMFGLGSLPLTKKQLQNLDHATSDLESPNWVASVVGAHVVR